MQTTDIQEKDYLLILLMEPEFFLVQDMLDCRSLLMGLRSGLSITFLSFLLILLRYTCHSYLSYFFFIICYFYFNCFIRKQGFLAYSEILRPSKGLPLLYLSLSLYLFPIKIPLIKTDDPKALFGKLW